MGGGERRGNTNIFNLVICLFDDKYWREYYIVNSLLFGMNISRGDEHTVVLVIYGQQTPHVYEHIQSSLIVNISRGILFVAIIFCYTTTLIHNNNNNNKTDIYVAQFPLIIFKYP